ncbi:hypothetical protein EGR_06028 [Echinococcus granulosus]|uniref:Uncharacterized protein n=1 Tax=Echinococcus granulosus TaxID=6210 RepID=W6UCY1_ECHGR|nr:hypothetical protein EGR_06028 [Echinococcus granulosus]EUB59165.1 hypothetical protein EGR_06028 [Echinococcus granulosus]
MVWNADEKLFPAWRMTRIDLFFIDLTVVQLHRCCCVHHLPTLSRLLPPLDPDLVLICTSGMLLSASAFFYHSCCVYCLDSSEQDFTPHIAA